MRLWPGIDEIFTNSRVRPVIGGQSDKSLIDTVTSERLPHRRAASESVGGLRRQSAPTVPNLVQTALRRAMHVGDAELLLVLVTALLVTVVHDVVQKRRRRRRRRRGPPARLPSSAAGAVD